MARRNGMLRRLGALGAVVVLSAVVAAVASGSRQSGSAGSALPPDVKKALDAQLAPWFARPKTIGITEPLKARPTGKLVEFLECAADPCKVIGQGFAKATKLMGVRYKSISAGATPESFQAAANQALSDKPVAVFMAALNKALITQQLAEMKAKGILTIDWATTDTPKDFTIFLLRPAEYHATGTAMGRYVIRASDGNANVLYVNQSIFTFTGPMLKGFAAALKNQCPGCKMQTIDTLPSDIATQIPAKVVSAIQADPSINWVVPAYGALALGVPQALAAAGLGGKVNMVTQAASANTWDDIKNGRASAVADIDLVMLAYYALDGMARKLNGQKMWNVLKFPRHFLADKKDLTFNPQTTTWHPIPGFEKQFAKLWGVK